CPNCPACQIGHKELMNIATLTPRQLFALAVSVQTLQNRSILRVDLCPVCPLKADSSPERPCAGKAESALHRRRYLDHPITSGHSITTQRRDGFPLPHPPQDRRWRNGRCVRG